MGLYLMAQNHGVYLTEKLAEAEANTEALKAEVDRLKTVAHNFVDDLAEKDAKIEALREKEWSLVRERDSLRNRLEDTVRDLTDAKSEIEALRERLRIRDSELDYARNQWEKEQARAEKLAEALRETTAALRRHFDGTCDGTEVRVALNARATLEQENGDA